MAQDKIRVDECALVWCKRVHDNVPSYKLVILKRKLSGLEVCNQQHNGMVFAMTKIVNN